MLPVDQGSSPGDAPENVFFPGVHGAGAVKTDTHAEIRPARFYDEKKK
jgi:hypothetical protein